VTELSFAVSFRAF